MGGGGGRPVIGDLGPLEQKAKDVLRQGDQTGKPNAFISFDHEDLNDVNLFRGQAKNENSEIEFNDWSVREPIDSERAEYIKGQIRERIRQSSVTVVYVSDATADSKWVDWEIRESIALGKNVIAFHKGDSPPKVLPPAMKELGIEPIPWTQKGIGSAIVRASQTKPPPEKK